MGRNLGESESREHGRKLFTTLLIVAGAFAVLAFGLLSAAGLSSMGDPGPGDSLEPPHAFYVLTASAGVAAVLAAATGLASLVIWRQLRHDQ